MTAEYRNPIAPGFNPDPSVVHVDGVFYLVTSTFYLFPGVPVYASTNLRDWSLIGHAINRTQQLSLEHTHSRLVTLDTGHGMIATGGIQAPTIRYYRNRFWVIGTNAVRRDGKLLREQFIVSTSDIWGGEWTDPIHFGFYGFDTSFFVDDDDRVYVQGAWATDSGRQPLTVIYQLELDLDTGQIVTPARLIWEGHFRYDTEGPHIYKRFGWYYLIAAEGGTFEHHKLTVARSRDIWGPYESYEKNPILTAEGVDGQIQGLGHGELFQDSDENWWIVALGFRALDNGVWPLGRETFLAKVEWPEGGWPSVEQPSLTFQAIKVLETRALPSSVTSSFVYLRGREDTNYDISNDTIRLRPSQVTLGCLEGSPTFLGKRQQQHTASACVTLDLSSPGGALAGLVVHLDPLRYAYLAYDMAASKLMFCVVTASQDATVASHTVERGTEAVQLRVDASPAQYAFTFADTSERWRQAGSVSTAALFVRNFTGPIFGIFAQGGSVIASEPAVTFWDFVVA